jgi:hypothetical protein
MLAGNPRDDVWLAILAFRDDDGLLAAALAH